MREIIRLKIADSLAAQPPRLTRRDVHVPLVKGRAVAVIGPRRAGKTTLLWQVLTDRLAAGTPREALLYFNFECAHGSGPGSRFPRSLAGRTRATPPGVRGSRQSGDKGTGGAR